MTKRRTSGFGLTDLTEDSDEGGGLSMECQREVRMGMGMEIPMKQESFSEPLERSKESSPR